MQPVEKIRNIILENNYFDTLAGQRFKEWNNIGHIQAVISFGGRSKFQESYRLPGSSDSDVEFVTHLYIGQDGETRAIVQDEDNDDMSVLIGNTGVRIELFSEDILLDWLELFKFK